ncbi:hypothetical protein BH10ACT2_BH10ACT2_24830 [soil metagenome]
MAASISEAKGSWEGQVVIPADFDELPGEVVAAFAGELP